ncbi:phosphoglycerol transferase [Pseudobutyrivibrio sp. NOR37]|uniref:Sulfatase-like hydrolase/transferase n=1 Tax=Pseudobutyrivibrio xylanivorans TaxID=185007 RepID=A0A6M0LK74_PSEXY|nr:MULTISPECIES: sulfatase-like hydrolase/transferase [Pseudobutyrivibrio]NEX02257.1 sulfatase-like hydrolase/transferase [Pseudobutyrivibrio xylanivorans]SFR77455.1 phosphoglycerol transferase [Pseudobutyrivibrio sp. NOR37]
MKKPILKMIPNILVYLFLALLLVLFGTISYFTNTWKELTYQEILFHLKTSIEGTNPDMIISGLVHYGIPMLFLFVVLVVILHIVKKKNPKIKMIVAAGMLLVLLVANIFNIIRFNNKTNVITDYINSKKGITGPDFVGENYVDPATVSLTFPEKKRNLIYIYLESMEMTYADKENGGGFDFNCIPNLTKLSEENDNFSGDSSTLNGGIILPGMQWTTAALFAQSSGLPMQMGVDESKSDKSDGFFTDMTAIGDILQNEGYQNMVQLGSSANFGAIAAFFKDHGDFTIHDLNWAYEEGLIPSDYYVNWGYEDEKLFDYAKTDLLELSKSDQPFNYTMFTIDTHFEDGYVCRLCGHEFGDNQYANVMACSDRQVTDFVNWIKQQDFYDNTTIVITGDHTTMDSDFCDDVADEYQRKTYTCIINSTVSPEKEEFREYATMDLFPTTLAALGVEMSSNRLGCGTNLYSSDKTLIEQYGKDKCNDEFSKPSKLIMDLANDAFTDEDLAKAQEVSYMEVADEDGTIRFRLQDADTLNMSDVRSLKLSVVDYADNEKIYDFDMDIEANRVGWCGVVHSEIPYDHLDQLMCRVYISIGDYENYIFKDFAPVVFKIWDIKMDNSIE